MSRNLSQAFIKQLKTLSQTQAWKLFLELQMDDTSSFYLTNNETDLTFQAVISMG